MTINYTNKKELLKWITNNLDQLDKFTKITPAHTDDDDKAILSIEIGTETNKLTIEIDKSRIGIIDIALHCLTIAQSMSDEPIRTNGKAH